MSIRPIAEEWEYSDARYKSKKISNWLVELKYGTQRGGVILLWKKATEEDIQDEKDLPHIYTISEDGNWKLEDQVNFMYNENAQSYYSELNTVKDIQNLIWENR